MIVDPVHKLGDLGVVPTAHTTVTPADNTSQDVSTVGPLDAEGSPAVSLGGDSTEKKIGFNFALKKCFSFSFSSRCPSLRNVHRLIV